MFLVHCYLIEEQVVLKWFTYFFWYGHLPFVGSFLSICADLPRDKMRRNVIQHGFPPDLRELDGKSAEMDSPIRVCLQAHKEKNHYGVAQSCSLVQLC